ncbi:Type II secretory pathway, component PulM [Andreprevotia lacus DSM 23236]|jgi:type II secretory pathway component PulM|uniref:Type II secretory pathway, component PulM n=1 Tax=Andreprevotia lacus DSM 23236 TaxID=1121001 RepID=A0A1W1XLJ1_9NEIS|nr:type II secretion system protein GspM [Andreprevotia lacus]SMC24732.1 Type II secretory pathway, component PulM [Andreprevotia lacus DSM 23236]
MKQLKQTVLAYWQARNEREQRMLTLCGVVVALFVLYAGLWQPLSKAQASQQQQLPRLQQSLIELQQGITALKGQPATGGNDGDLRTTVQAQLDRYGIKADLQVLPQERIKLQAGQLDTDKALKLIAALERGAGLHLEESHLSGNAGQLQLSMTVGR